MKYPITRSPLLETAQVRGDRTFCSHLNSETSLERKICSGRGSWSGNSEGYSQHFFGNWMSYWVLECKYKYLLLGNLNSLIFFKISVQVSLFIGFSYSPDKPIEYQPGNCFCCTFCIFYSKNVGSKFRKLNMHCNPYTGGNKRISGACWISIGHW